MITILPYNRRCKWAAQRVRGRRGMLVMAFLPLMAISLAISGYRYPQMHLSQQVQLAEASLNTAPHYLKSYQILEDSLKQEQRAVQDPQVLLQVDELNKQLAQQAHEISALRARLRRENYLNWALGFAGLLLLIGVLAYFQKYRSGKSLSEQLQAKNLLIIEQKEEIESIYMELARQVALRLQSDDMINYFASSLFGKNTVDDVLWDVAKNCISRLGFVDCVIYLLDQERQVLVQKAAYGTKNPEDYTIFQPIEIPVGQGIVGWVAQHGQAALIKDTRKDPRYIVDDAMRLSELAVPLIHQQQVIGVIDSEHPDVGFFEQWHLESLLTIASICTSKISQAQADEEAARAKASQQEAEQIKKMDQVKSQFFANISHEFRTPLHLILAPLRKKDEEISSDEMNMMERNAQRLLRLVNQLLDLAKLEVGMLTFEPQHHPLYPFLRQLAQGFQPLAQQKDIRMDISIPDGDFFAWFDPDKLEKIVYNLLSNAVKFTPPHGAIAFEVTANTPESIQITIRDSGLGVPRHLKDRIFDRFYQVDGTHTRAFEGTGIGLALTKELVDLCGGTIRLVSEERQGSEFTVSLPLGTAPTEQTQVHPPKISPHLTEELLADSYSPNNEEKPQTDPDTRELDKPRVLIVEDHLELRDHLCKQLEAQFQTIQATNGQEGIEAARKHVPDLIISDVMMPQMDGLTFVRHLKASDLTSHIPVILLTAKDDQQTKQSGFEQGAEQYLTKPFAPAELVARINALLAQRARLQKKYSRDVLLQPKATAIPDREAAFLERAMEIVNEHLANEQFSVEDFQRLIGMSRMQLHRKLKALTDQSATEFIRSVRLKHAANLLKQPDLQVAEVAFLSGFNHLSYFARCFKEAFGLTPSQYQEQASQSRD